MLSALNVFTFCGPDQIARAAQDLRTAAAARAAQRLLADSVTTIVHGADAAAAAQAEQAAIFGQVEGPGSDATPHLLVTAAELESGLELRQLLVDCGLAPSRSQARRLMAQGAIRVNGRKRQEGLLRSSDLDTDGLILLAAGSRNRRLIGLRETGSAAT